MSYNTYDDGEWVWIFETKEEPVIDDMEWYWESLVSANIGKLQMSVEQANESLLYTEPA